MDVKKLGLLPYRQAWQIQLSAVAALQKQEGGGALLTPTLLFRLGLCGVGALGALSAVRCTRTEQDA